jgi:PAS domain S-box-containing protein
LESSGVPVLDAAGNVLGFRGADADVTQRRETQEALRRSEEELRKLYESMRDAFACVDLAGRILRCNTAYQEMLGYTEAELRALRYRDITVERWHDTEATIVRDQVLARGYSDVYEKEYRKKDGTVFPVELRAFLVRNGAGEPAAMWAIVRDISERKRTQEALQKSQTTLNAIIDSTDDMIWSVDSDAFGLMTFNHALREYFFQRRGIRLKPGMQLVDLAPTGDYVQRWRGFYERALQEGPYTIEYSLYPHTTLLQLSFNVLKRDGRIFGVSVFGKDITAYRRAEKEANELRSNLAHSGRVTLLGQLASATAHELNQPLGAILRNAEAGELMLQEPELDLNELRAVLADIHGDVQRASAVIDRLRSLLKRRVLQLQPIQLESVIDEVVALVRADAAARRVKLFFSAGPGLPRVQGDRIHLQQVLLNLLMNALDALAAGASKEPYIDIVAQRTEAGMILVRVCDNGPGFRGETQKRLFEPFFTTKPNGMGMGLPVSQTIIEAHHGKLWAENRPEGGACFCFILPVAGGS